MSLIERQAAIDFLSKWITYNDDGEQILEVNPDTVFHGIEALPSAQPEIIRCKDCEHGMYDFMCHFYWCHGAAHSANWFCADAERRTDE